MTAWRNSSQRDAPEVLENTPSQKKAASKAILSVRDAPAEKAANSN